jgi:hypothetical protein
MVCFLKMVHNSKIDEIYLHSKVLPFLLPGISPTHTPPPQPPPAAICTAPETQDIERDHYFICYEIFMALLNAHYANKEKK